MFNFFPDPDIPPVSLKLSLGDLESDILMRQVESEDSIVKGEENTRKSIPTPEMGNVLRGKEPFAKSLCPPEPGKRKYRSQLLQKLPKASNAPSHDSQVIKSPDSPKEVKYDPAPPRCYEWSKPTKKPQMSAPVPPTISEGGSYQNVEIKVCGSRVLRNTKSYVQILYFYFRVVVMKYGFSSESIVHLRIFITIFHAANT